MADINNSQPTTGAAEGTTPGGEQKRGARKVRVGQVVSDKMQKTVVVKIDRRVPHPIYGKMVTRSTRLKAHDEENTCKVGDTVRIQETRPLSKDKRWRYMRFQNGHVTLHTRAMRLL